MSITPAELEQARAWQRDLMADTCTITRPGDGGQVWDEATETMRPAPPATVYDGPCRIAAAVTQPAQVDAAGEAVVIQSWWVTLPWNAAGIQDGDTLTMTTCADPDLVGAALTVEGIQGSTLVTARRLLCRRAR